MKIKSRKLQDRRHYLRRRLKETYPVNGTQRTIDVPYNSFEEIPIGDRFYIGQLIKLGFIVQYKLF